MQTTIDDTTTMRKVGNSFGVTLPKDIVSFLSAQEGDILHITKQMDGSINLSPYDPNFALDMQAAASIANRYKNALRKLAE